MDPLERHLQRQIDRSKDFFWHRLRWEAVAAYLPRTRSFTLLDIGAGAGLLGQYLSRAMPAARYRFVEPLPALRRHLELRFGRDANGGRLSSYDVDVITLLDVLEHQKDDGAFLRDLSERMRSGALLILTVPALRSLWSEWDVALGHHRRYRRDELIRCLARCPLEIVEVSYVFPELVPAAWVRRLLRPAGRRPVRSSIDETALPDLPRVLNEVLYAIGRASVRVRRVWPLGTSIFAVARRR